MSNSPLRQFLQSLCCDSPWNYTVFWKLQLHHHMLLTWEDGCYHSSRPGKSLENIIDCSCLHALERMLSSESEPSINEQNVAECPIGAMVAEMSGLHYTLGEGLVGDVAFSGNHRWIFSDSILSGEFNSKLAPEYPVEWLSQFVVGIKTILLVAVIPHGVLQLGSLQRVTEGLVLIDHIKDKFYAHLTFEESFLPLIASNEFLDQKTCQMSIHIENLDKSSGIDLHEVKSEYSDAHNNVKPTYQRLSNANQMLSSSMIHNMCTVLEEDILKILNVVKQNGNDVQSTCLIEEPKPVNQLLDGHVLEISDHNISRFPCLEGELEPFSDNNYSLGDSTNCGLTSRNFCSNDDIIIEPDTDKNVDWSISNDENNFYHFPRYCELFKALGPTFLCHTNGYLHDSLLSAQFAHSDSCLVSDGNFVKGSGPSIWETGESFVNIDEPVHILEPVIAYEGGGLNDNLYHKSISTSLGQSFVSSMTKSDGSAFIREHKSPWNHEISAFVSQGGNANTSCHQSAFSFTTTMSTVVEDQKKGDGCLHIRTGSKLTSNKKRVKTGDRKARPRDRQLIQDRLKELRELVPYGAKCSIDGLLDRTIKHMLFLRSAADQADKLRQYIHKVTDGEKNIQSCEGGGAQQNGSSWAFEVGTEHQVCPIVVKDLEYPGHLLIEMLCNDHLHFLEIAEVIQRCNLTILKGVLESLTGDMWACFIVEAARGFHRLDIFWPLMRLLEQN